MSEVSLSMLPPAPLPSAAVVRLQHRLHAERSARIRVERENTLLRQQVQMLVRRLAKRGDAVARPVKNNNGASGH
jgi:hypothetical protein